MLLGLFECGEEFLLRNSSFSVIYNGRNVSEGEGV